MFSFREHKFLNTALPTTKKFANYPIQSHKYESPDSHTIIVEVNYSACSVYMPALNVFMQNKKKFLHFSVSHNHP